MNTTISPIHNFDTLLSSRKYNTRSDNDIQIILQVYILYSKNRYTTCRGTIIL